MLATITEYRQKITLIRDSGVQFLDFALTPALNPDFPGKFVRQTANGPLLRLDYNEETGRYFVPASAGTPPEVVKPEFSFSLEQSLSLLDNLWLPLPVFRFTPPRTLQNGPDNWARVRIRALDAPDRHGLTHRVTLVFDTRIYPAEHSDPSLAPTENDLQNGAAFTLAHRSHELGEFLDLTWVDGWLRDVFTKQIERLENRTVREMDVAFRSFEYQAHYLNLLEMLGSQLRVPEIAFSAGTLQEPAVDVDLILDVGNSHTCGVLVEDSAGEPDGLKQTYELQLRDLSEPQFLYNELFVSRVEFAQARFGKDHFSLESGRDDAFMWPSITRVGSEAERLALQRHGLNGATGISSPRRYLWDEESFTEGWRFNPGPEGALHESPAVAAPFTFLINDEGTPLYLLPAEERIPAFSPLYSRSSLMTLMLCELLAQALMQINSVAQRLKMKHEAAPRRLRSIVLTLPSAMPKPERDIFLRRMHEAIGLVWKAMGWHNADDDFKSAKDKAQSRVPVPTVQMEWDEATCGQMVYVYNETQVNFGGHTAAFFAAMARPDVPRAAAGKSLRIASIDIGGGTTDLAITQYSLDDGIGKDVKITPALMFREGFKVAGDDILLDVIRLFVLPALQHALAKAGMTEPGELLNRLFGDDGRLDGQVTLRQQAALQVFIPIGHAILTAYEGYDPLDPQAEIDAAFGELIPLAPTSQVLAYIQEEVRREVTQKVPQKVPQDAAPFEILKVPLTIRLGKLHEAFLSQGINLSRHLRSLSEVVALYDCDVLLLTGRPARFPGIQALFRHLQPLPTNRILSLDGYHTNEWYPFNQRGRIANPKSTAAVGAMICLLALNLRLPGFYFKAGDFESYSTLRYLGMLDGDHRLPVENVYYQDIDLDAADFTLNAKVSFRLRGAMTLGFRQLDNARWPASALYRLSIVDQQLARRVAGDGELRVKLKLTRGESSAEPLGFDIASAELEDGTRVPRNHLRLALNTLADSGLGATDYWIDSGSVFNK